MSISLQHAGFIKVAGLTDIAPGGTKAVKLDEQRSVALFNVDGRIYGINEVGIQVREYLNTGFSGERLLKEIGITILKDDTGNFILPTLRTIFDEWENPLIAKHPSRNQLLIGLARYATDVR